MSQQSYQNLINNGLWVNNPALVQLLGLCPLLATTTTVINGFVMGLSTILVLVISASTVGIIRHWINPSLRLVSFMFIIASAVTLIELLMKVKFYELYVKLGLFIPLIVTNCMIVARVEAFSSKQHVSYSLVDALFMGIGFTWVLVILGGMREILSKGSLFSGAESLFGQFATHWHIQIFEPNTTLIGYLPMGAFILFGLMLATKQKIDNYEKNS